MANGITFLRKRERTMRRKSSHLFRSIDILKDATFAAIIGLPFQLPFYGKEAPAPSPSVGSR